MKQRHAKYFPRGKIKPGSPYDHRHPQGNQSRGNPRRHHAQRRRRPGGAWAPRRDRDPSRCREQPLGCAVRRGRRAYSGRRRSGLDAGRPHPQGQRAAGRRVPLSATRPDPVHLPPSRRRRAAYPLAAGPPGDGAGLRNHPVGRRFPAAAGADERGRRALGDSGWRVESASPERRAGRLAERRGPG